MDKKQNILTGVIAGGGVVLVILGVFIAGVHMGRGQDYKRYFPFWEKRHTYRSFIPKKLNGHGVYGRIESLGEGSMVVEERDGALKTVLWDEQTLFRKDHSSSSADELVEGENIVVIGAPSEEENAVSAKVIRVMGQRQRFASPSAQLEQKL